MLRFHRLHEAHARGGESGEAVQVGEAEQAGAARGGILVVSGVIGIGILGIGVSVVFRFGQMIIHQYIEISAGDFGVVSFRHHFF